MNVQLVYKRGMKLSEWMANSGIDDDQMAEKCAVDRVTISRIRRDVNRPSWPLIAKIKDITDGAVNADDFCQVEAAESNSSP